MLSMKRFEGVTRILIDSIDLKDITRFPCNKINYTVSIIRRPILKSGQYENIIIQTS